MCGLLGAVAFRLDADSATSSVPDDAVRVVGDVTRLAQIVGNVLNNAIKYTPSDGHIDVTLACRESTAFIAVKDNGVGIPAEQLAQVFDMFAQVNQTLDRAQGGLGIGLALVRKLAAMHGGTIVGTSDGAGRGSTFTVSLPLAAADSATPTLAEAPPPLETAPALDRAARLLVVDDNHDAADTLAMLLATRGHELSVRYSGAEGIEAARSLRPDIVFCDIGMPEIGGYEVAQRLRANDTTRDCFLVAVTGWGTDEDKQRSRTAGFDIHLTKPVAEQAIDEVLALAQERRHRFTTSGGQLQAASS